MCAPWWYPPVALVTSREVYEQKKMLMMPADANAKANYWKFMSSFKAGISFKPDLTAEASILKHEEAEVTKDLVRRGVNI